VSIEREDKTAERRGGRRRSEEPVATPAPAPERSEVTTLSADSKRGPLSPAQHDDDGWGDTPVQMRG
jgi:hypothetical protein